MYILKLKSYAVYSKRREKHQDKDCVSFSEYTILFFWSRFVYKKKKNAREKKYGIKLFKKFG